MIAQLLPRVRWGNVIVVAAAGLLLALLAGHALRNTGGPPVPQGTITQERMLPRVAPSRPSVSTARRAAGAARRAAGTHQRRTRTSRRKDDGPASTPAVRTITARPAQPAYSPAPAPAPARQPAAEFRP